MRFRSAFILLIAALLFYSGCNYGGSNSLENETLTVSAAVSLKDAFTEIGAVYKSKTGKSVIFNFGASGTLQKQIETGAPVDVFASAGGRQMDELAAKDLIDADSRKDFARNSLVLIAAKNHGDTIFGFEIITKPQIEKIAVGNPKTVPAGQYADELFEKMNLKKDLQTKLIFAENVRQVLDYVSRGEVNLGIVYKTDASVANDKIDIVAVAPEDSHSPILYPIAILKDSRNKQPAREFLDFVLSAEGQKILQKYGFSGV